MARSLATKQPNSLYLLFFTELWERFGFYTLQTIIILYMTKGLAMPDTQANLLYAAFSSLLYLTPMLGGYIADRYIGFQRAIMIGGILFVIAYICAAFPGKNLFFLGLSLLICAHGLFKPNVSAIVGELYHENDPRRDGGFTIFYMGINIGSLLPPLIAGTLVVHYGWHAGFVLAAVGMLIGQVIFILGRKQLGDIGLYARAKNATKRPGITFYSIFFAGLAAITCICLIALRHPAETTHLIEISTVLIFLMVIGFLFREPLQQRKRMFASLILIFISIGFWALYNQTFTSLMLFADRNMSKHILGLPIDAEFTQFFNPFFIIALSPLLSRLWLRMDQLGLNPSTQSKFAWGMIFMSVGYLSLAFGAKFFGVQGVTSPWWLVLSYLLQTTGELLISPIGLAMITVLCPRHLVGMMMGVWFFSQTAACAMTGRLANIAAVPANISTTASLEVYAHAFFVYGVISLILTIVSFCCVPLVNRLIKK
jgi:POT family proton-dependent oligopeptide transporter